MGVFDSWNAKVRLEVGQQRAFPGLPVDGTVRISVEKDMECRGIWLSYRNREKVHWSEGGQYRTSYTSKKDIHRIIVCLAGSGEPGNAPPMQLPRGEYTFPFRFVIPPDALPTFSNGLLGHMRVKHTIRAWVACGTMSADHVVELGVTRFVPRSRIEAGRAPASVPVGPLDVKGCCCCCCFTCGHIAAGATMSQSAVVVGRDTSVHVRVEVPQSSRPVKKVSARFIARAVGTATMDGCCCCDDPPRKTREDTKTLCEVPLAEAGNWMWEGELPLGGAVLDPKQPPFVGLTSSMRYYLEGGVDCGGCTGDTPVQLEAIVASPDAIDETSTAPFGFEPHEEAVSRVPLFIPAGKPLQAVPNAPPNPAPIHASPVDQPGSPPEPKQEEALPPFGSMAA